MNFAGRASGNPQAASSRREAPSAIQDYEVRRSINQIKLDLERTRTYLWLTLGLAVLAIVSNVGSWIFIFTSKPDSPAHHEHRELERLNMKSLQLTLSKLAEKINLIKACPIGYIIDGERCYKVVDKPHRSWSQAREYCNLDYDDYDLVSIGSLAERNFVHQKTDYLSNFWIGLTLKATTVDGAWVWNDGSAFDKTIANWDEMDTNYAGDAKKCCTIGRNTTWKTQNCDIRKSFVCEGVAF